MKMIQTEHYRRVRIEVPEMPHFVQPIDPKTYPKPSTEEEGDQNQQVPGLDK